MEATATTPVARERRVVSRRATAVRRPLAGLLLCGIGLMLLGAWGGIVAYVGPAFGYGPVGAHTWQWNTQHTVLNLIPGAATVLAGLLVASAGGVRRVAGLAGGLLALGAAAWFVLGALVYPIFYGTGPMFAPGAGHAARAEFVIRLGYGLGVGLSIALLVGMALAMLGRPALVASRERVAADPVIDVRDREPAVAAEEEAAARR